MDGRCNIKQYALHRGWEKTCYCSWSHASGLKCEHQLVLFQCDVFSFFSPDGRMNIRALLTQEIEYSWVTLWWVVRSWSGVDTPAHWELAHQHRFLNCNKVVPHKGNHLNHFRLWSLHTLSVVHIVSKKKTEWCPLHCSDFAALPLENLWIWKQHIHPHLRGSHCVPWLHHNTWLQLTEVVRNTNWSPPAFWGLR